jgi:pentatricopeptide repeat protein
MLSAYARDGQYKEALQLLDRIPQEGIEVNKKNKKLQDENKKKQK